MKLESWWPVDGYEGLYEVSSFGNVRSLHYDKNRILAFGKHTQGYNSVCLSKFGKTKVFKVAILVARSFIPRPSLAHWMVNHIDGVKTNDCITNLEWVTPSENTKHAFRIGLILSQKGKLRKRRTICKRGHPLTPDNVYKQRCRICGRARSNQYYKRKTLICV